MEALKKYDVLILGAGITSIGAYLGLRAKSSTLRIAMLFDKSIPATSKLTPGIAHEFPIDNYTRTAGSWGEQNAIKIWRYHSYCYQQIVNQFDSCTIRYQTSDGVRQPADDFENKEILEACDELSRIFPNIKLQRSDGSHNQIEQNAVAFFEPTKLEHHIWSKIKKDTNCFVLNCTIKGIEQSFQGISIHTASSGEILGEIAISGLHTGLKSLIPDLGSVLISYSDQFHFYRLSKAKKNQYFSKKHGLLWKANCGNYEFYGGARYLRPHAGIEAETATFETRIQDHIEAQFHDTKNVPIKNYIPKGEFAFQEIRPCDELPIVGPMYNMDRLLISTGYMQRGLSLAIGSGVSIGELIIDGESNHLPRVLWPERLRSL